MVAAHSARTKREAIFPERKNALGAKITTTKLVGNFKVNISFD